MQLVDQWRAIERSLEDGWASARLLLRLENVSRASRAGALLAPANPGRSGGEVRLTAARNGTAPGPEAIRRLLARLDDEQIGGELELVATEAAAAPAPVGQAHFADRWRELLVALPPDWSHLYAELDLPSTDYLERAALLLAPANPARFGRKTGFRFRCARLAGYGISAGMATRCLERLDEEGITGTVHILRVVSDVRLVATQGPVWYVGGKSV